MCIFNGRQNPGARSGHLTATGSRYNFPGVDHEGRQTFRLTDLLVIALENKKRFSSQKNFFSFKWQSFLK